jgi:hypothetical protein
MKCHVVSKYEWLTTKRYCDSLFRIVHIAYTPQVSVVHALVFLVLPARLRD